MKRKPNMYDLKRIKYNDKFVADSVKELNQHEFAIIYCYNKEQIEQIIKHCKYRCKTEIKDNLYIIKRA